MRFTQIVVLGSGKVAVACINMLAAHTRAVQTIEQEAQPLSFVKAVSGKHGLPYRLITDKRELTAFLTALEENTLVISANNNYLFPRAVLAKPNLRVVNFHNALLPAHPGRNAPTWAIFSGDDCTGITWHLVDAGVDTGDILLQKKVAITPDMTALELTKQCMDAGIEAFGELLPALLAGNFAGYVQEKRGCQELHYSYDVPNGGQLDVDWPLAKMSAFLRSLDYGRLQLFAPAAVSWAGRRYLIRRYSIGPASGSERGAAFGPGELVFQDEALRICLGLEETTA